MPDSRPRLVVWLVGVADYMSAGLEGNDNHTSTCTLNIYNECTCTVTNLQSILPRLIYKTRQTNVIVEKTWSVLNLTMLGPKLYGKIHC